MSANVGAKDIVTEGLVLYLDAANYKSYTSGSTVWRDMSANNYSGSLVNGPTFDLFNGGSLLFDGTNDYTNLQNVGVTNLPAFSISFWAKKFLATGSPTVYSENTPASWTNNLFIFYFGDSANAGKCRVYFAGTNRLIGTTNVSDGKWYYATYNQISTSNRSLYVNGIVEATNTSLISHVATNTYIACANNNGTLTQYGNNYIANLSCYNRALSAQEILQNYNATKARFGLT